VKLNNNISINFVGLIEYSSIEKIIMDGLDWILSLMDGFDFLNEVVIVIVFGFREKLISILILGF
jgi:hypothetical protein